MKISLKNFGPLKEFEMDLDADFTLIVGENNIGKSYAISLLYAILKTLLSSEIIDRPYFGGYIFDRVFEKNDNPTRDEFIKAYKSPTTKDINISALVKQFTKNIAGVIFVDSLEKTIEGTFGGISNLQNRRCAENTIICISTTVLSIELQITDNSLSLKDISMLPNIVYRKSKVGRRPRQTDKETIIYGSSDNVDQAEVAVFSTALNRLRDFAVDVAGTISDIHYLPASRSGLYQALSAFGQIIAELSKRRNFLSQRIELPAISEPLVDYFLKLNEVRPLRKSIESGFISIAEELEKNILGGAVEFDQKSKRLFYKPFDMDLKLDLSSTSSMVSEVAPIVTYLKHVLPETEQRRTPRRPSRTRVLDGLKRKQIIFIEEPEAHLHPRTQVMLMDAFARLVKDTDVKLIMTSHSNFVFNKISNLVISRAFGGSKIEAFRFSRTENGTESHHLEIDDSGITDENFADVAEELFAERMELFENQNFEARTGNDPQ